MLSASGNVQQLFGGVAANSPMAPLQSPDLRSGESFVDALRRQYQGDSPNTSGGTPDTPPSANLHPQTNTTPTPEQIHAKAVKAAQGLVANALILPVLKQLRQDPFGQNTIFSPGTGEKTFGPQFDMQIADRIAQSPNMAATQVLTRRLESRGKLQVQPSASRAMNNQTGSRPGVNVHG